MYKTGYYKLDENHKPIKVTLEYWSRWFEDVENRRLRTTHLLEYRALISSVFLGLPLNGGMFETMVRKTDNEKIYRYETYEECLKAHDRIVKDIEKKGETKEKG